MLYLHTYVQPTQHVSKHGLNMQEQNTTDLKFQLIAIGQTLVLRAACFYEQIKQNYSLNNNAPYLLYILCYFQV